MDLLFNDQGYSLLFLLSFLAATVLPVGSEWMLVMMIVKGYSPECCVLVASVGNYLGGCTTLLIGWWGSEYIIQKFLRINEKQVMRARKQYEKYGSWSLFFSWVPVIGDPLCLVAGIFRINFLWFSLLVFSGKFFRYALLAYLSSG